MINVSGWEHVGKAVCRAVRQPHLTLVAWSSLDSSRGAKLQRHQEPKCTQEKIKWHPAHKRVLECRLITQQWEKLVLSMEILRRVRKAMDTVNKLGLNLAGTQPVCTPLRSPKVCWTWVLYRASLYSSPPSPLSRPGPFFLWNESKHICPQSCQEY